LRFLEVENIRVRAETASLYGSSPTKMMLLMAALAPLQHVMQALDELRLELVATTFFLLTVGMANNM
jgi:hypothetical protein